MAKAYYSTSSSQDGGPLYLSVFIAESVHSQLPPVSIGYPRILRYNSYIRLIYHGTLSNLYFEYNPLQLEMEPFIPQYHGAGVLCEVRAVLKNIMRYGNAYRPFLCNGQS